MTTTNPQSVYGEIKDAYLRYVDTAYWLRSEELIRKLTTHSHGNGTALH